MKNIGGLCFSASEQQALNNYARDPTDIPGDYKGINNRKSSYLDLKRMEDNGRKSIKVREGGYFSTHLRGSGFRVWGWFPISSTSLSP